MIMKVMLADSILGYSDFWEEIACRQLRIDLELRGEIPGRKVCETSRSVERWREERGLRMSSGTWTSWGGGGSRRAGDKEAVMREPGRLENAVLWKSKKEELLAGGRGGLGTNSADRLEKRRSKGVGLQFKTYGWYPSYILIHFCLWKVCFCFGVLHGFFL